MNLSQRNKRISSVISGGWKCANNLFRITIFREIFHSQVWKICFYSEIPTRGLTGELVQKCITLPFLSSSGTSHLLVFGHVLALARVSSVLRSQADLLGTPSRVSA